MIATITLNPCLDNYISVAHLEINETTRSKAISQYAGGKGLDVSRAIHEMGGETMAFGFAGGSEGITLTTLLAKEGVPFTFVPINEETRSCYFINQTDSAQQMRISTPGPGVSDKEVDELVNSVWALRPAPDILVCGGSVPPGLPADIYAVITRQAREHGIKTILDSSGAYLKEGVKAGPFLVKPNLREAIELLGRPLSSEKEIVDGAREIVRMGVEIAVISLGKDGLVAASRHEAVRAVPPAVTAVSTVGAGDSMVAGLAIALEGKEALVPACRLAVAMGTAAVLTPGTTLARRADVERILPLVRTEKLS
jgi:6-phosphofructokinase 2